MDYFEFTDQLNTRDLYNTRLIFICLVFQSTLENFFSFDCVETFLSKCFGLQDLETVIKKIVFVVFSLSPIVFCLLYAACHLSYFQIVTLMLAKITHQCFPILVISYFLVVVK